MEELFKRSSGIIDRTSLGFKRYLYDEIEWEDRLIGISGFRGVGKTMLMLQRMKEEYGNSLKAVYVTLDDLYFTKNSFIDFVDEFYINGGRTVFVDEIHRYPSWSVELKNVYDIYDDLKIVFSGSSALQLHKADGDLSRRAAMYNLHEMSFREYLHLSGNGVFKKYSLEEMLKDHVEIARGLTKKITPVPLFRDYLVLGVYPFFKEAKGRFGERLTNAINVVVEIDLTSIENISYHTTYKLKQLISVLADTVPFKVNITELSRRVNLSRDALLRLLTSLDRANLIKGIRREGAASGYLTKPDKLYLNNTALLDALHSVNINVEGTMRETFFMNQLLESHDVKVSKKGDFLIDGEFIFEVGGKNKGYVQIADVKNSFIAADNIETGYGNKIPLWLFGFLY